MITDPSEIQAHLRTCEVSLPDSWLPYVKLAKSMGAKIIPVSRISDDIDLGSSPGGSWSYKGEIFIEVGEDPQCSVLHEVCHWMVAKVLNGDHQKVNFGHSLLANSTEIETCDAQITWLLVHRDANAALEAAQFLQYDNADDSIQSTLDAGQRLWSDAGFPMEVTPELAQRLAHRINVTWTPEKSWSEMPYEI